MMFSPLCLVALPQATLTLSRSQVEQRESKVMHGEHHQASIHDPATAAAALTTQSRIPSVSDSATLPPHVSSLQYLQQQQQQQQQHPEQYPRQQQMMLMQHPQPHTQSLAWGAQQPAGTSLPPSTTWQTGPTCDHRGNLAGGNDNAGNSLANLAGRSWPLIDQTMASLGGGGGVGTHGASDAGTASALSTQFATQHGNGSFTTGAGATTAGGGDRGSFTAEGGALTAGNAYFTQPAAGGQGGFDIPLQLSSMPGQPQGMLHLQAPPPGVRTGSDNDLWLGGSLQDFALPWEVPTSGQMHQQQSLHQQQLQQHQPGMFALRPLPTLPALSLPSQQQLPQSVGARGFEAYESQHGPSLKCQAGTCAHVVESPCPAHKCVCCKMNRQVHAFSRQGWCGPCGKREVVSGLRFVRCGRCKAEMLESTYQAHLKQNVAVTDENGKRVTGRCADAGREIVDIDKGRRCGKCTNMRPITFYPCTDTNCTCNVHNPVYLNAARSPKNSSQQQQRRLASPSPSVGNATPQAGGGGGGATASGVTATPGSPSGAAGGVFGGGGGGVGGNSVGAVAQGPVDSAARGEQLQPAAQSGPVALQAKDVLTSAQDAMNSTQTLSQDMASLMSLCQQLTTAADPSASSSSGNPMLLEQLLASSTGGGGTPRQQLQQLRSLQASVLSEAQRVAAFASALGTLLGTAASGFAPGAPGSLHTHTSVASAPALPRQPRASEADAAFPGLSPPPPGFVPTQGAAAAAALSPRRMSVASGVAGGASATDLPRLGSGNSTPLLTQQQPLQQPQQLATGLQLKATGGSVSAETLDAALAQQQQQQQGASPRSPQLAAGLQQQQQQQSPTGAGQGSPVLAAAMTGVMATNSGAAGLWNITVPLPSFSVDLAVADMLSAQPEKTDSGEDGAGAERAAKRARADDVN